MAAPLRARYSVPQQQLFSASELRYVERRPYPLDAVCLGDFRIDRLFAGNSKEIFRLPSRREPDQHPSRLLTDVCPYMRHISWREYGNRPAPIL